MPRESPVEKMQKKFGFNDMYGVLFFSIVAAVLGGVGMGIYNAGRKKGQLNLQALMEMSTGEVPDLEVMKLIYGLLMASLIAFLIAFLYWAGRSVMLASGIHKHTASYFVYGFFTFSIILPVVYVICDLVSKETYPYCDKHTCILSGVTPGVEN